MVFLRLKKINNQFYCYLVQNKRTRGKPRQKVKKYLGKALLLKSSRELDFFTFYQLPQKNLKKYFQKKTIEEILFDLVRLELIKHGFQEREGFLSSGDLYYNKKKFQVFQNKKPLVICLNNGFLCSFTLKRIIDLSRTTSPPPYLLAKYFVESGLKVPPTVFIEFYRKIRL